MIYICVAQSWVKEPDGGFDEIIQIMSELAKSRGGVEGGCRSLRVSLSMSYVYQKPLILPVGESLMVIDSS